MVGIAQLVERQIVALKVMGSSPITHPILIKPLGCSQVVRHETLTLASVGSNPATPANFTNLNNIYGPLAQLVEHMTFNHGVPRSNRGWVTKYADVAELADAIDLGSISREWGFKSSHPHHKKSKGLIQKY